MRYETEIVEFGNAFFGVLHRAIADWIRIQMQPIFMLKILKKEVVENWEE